MSDGWLEPRTRIPFVGIVAIVVIVAVVAIFLKTQLGPFFPKSEITVESGPEQNTAGSASASFYGLREIQLQPKEYLQGTLNTPAGSASFTVDVPAKLLTITRGSEREEVELHENGERLVAQFESDGRDMRVDIDAAGRYMLVSEPGNSVEPSQIALGDSKVYRGFFTVRNQQYLFQYSPAGAYATISAAKTSTVALNADGTMYRGVWQEGGKAHPVTVDTSKLMATIEDIF